MTGQLHIPDGAVTALYDADPGRILTGDDRDQAIARAIATPVVAAELRRIADSVAAEKPRPSDRARRDVGFGLVVAEKMLRARADELDQRHRAEQTAPEPPTT